MIKGKASGWVNTLATGFASQVIRSTIIIQRSSSSYMNPFSRGKEVCFCHYRVQTFHAAHPISCLNGTRRPSFPSGSMVTVQSKPLSSTQSPGQQARCFTSTHPNHPYEKLTARETLYKLRKKPSQQIKTFQVLQNVKTVNGADIYAGCQINWITRTHVGSHIGLIR